MFFAPQGHGPKGHESIAQGLYLFSAIGRIAAEFSAEFRFFRWLPAKTCVKKRGCLLPN